MHLCLPDARARTHTLTAHIHVHTHSLTCTLTLTHSYTLTLTHSLSLTLTHSHAPTHSFTHSFTHFYTHSFTHSLSLTRTHPLPPYLCVAWRVQSLLSCRGGSAMGARLAVGTARSCPTGDLSSSGSEQRWRHTNTYTHPFFLSLLLSLLPPPPPPPPLLLLLLLYCSSPALFLPVDCALAFWFCALLLPLFLMLRLFLVPLPLCACTGAVSDGHFARFDLAVITHCCACPLSLVVRVCMCGGVGGLCVCLSVCVSLCLPVCAINNCVPCFLV